MNVTWETIHNENEQIYNEMIQRSKSTEDQISLYYDKQKKIFDQIEAIPTILPLPIIMIPFSESNVTTQQDVTPRVSATELLQQFSTQGTKSQNEFKTEEKSTQVEITEEKSNQVALSEDKKEEKNSQISKIYISWVEDLRKEILKSLEDPVEGSCPEFFGTTEPVSAVSEDQECKETPEKDSYDFFEECLKSLTELVGSAKSIFSESNPVFLKMENDSIVKTTEIPEHLTNPTPPTDKSTLASFWGKTVVPSSTKTADSFINVVTTNSSFLETKTTPCATNASLWGNSAGNVISGTNQGNTVDIINVPSTQGQILGNISSTVINTGDSYPLTTNQPSFLGNNVYSAPVTQMFENKTTQASFIENTYDPNIYSVPTSQRSIFDTTKDWSIPLSTQGSLSNTSPGNIFTPTTTQGSFWGNSTKGFGDAGNTSETKGSIFGNTGNSFSQITSQGSWFGNNSVTTNSFGDTSNQWFSKASFDPSTDSKNTTQANFFNQFEMPSFCNKSPKDNSSFGNLGGQGNFTSHGQTNLTNSVFGQTQQPTTQSMGIFGEKMSFPQSLGGFNESLNRSQPMNSPQAMNTSQSMNPYQQINSHQVMNPSQSMNPYQQMNSPQAMNPSQSMNPYQQMNSPQPMNPYQPMNNHQSMFQSSFGGMQPSFSAVFLAFVKVYYIEPATSNFKNLGSGELSIVPESNRHSVKVTDKNGNKILDFPITRKWNGSKKDGDAATFRSFEPDRYPLIDTVFCARFPDGSTRDNFSNCIERLIGTT